jgi:hypothetical protein
MASIPAPMARIVAPTAPDRLALEAQTARAYAAAQHAPATRRACRSDWRIFQRWCTAHGLLPLPATPAVVATFMGAQAAAEVKPATLARRVAAIRYAHARTGLVPPTQAELVRATLRGVRRRHGVAPAQKAPAPAARLLAMVAHTPETLGIDASYT